MPGRPDQPSAPPGAARGDFDVAGLRRRLGALTHRDEERLGRRLQRLRGVRDPERRGGDLQRLLTEIDEAEALIARRTAARPTAITYPEELPVSARRDDLRAAIEAHQVIVVAGETGSGKTTQLPKICLELGRGIRGTIAHTQPRRLAARTVAERIAFELGVPLGGAVGYSVRFQDHAKDDTLVRLVTDGLLLAEIQRDRLLRRYDTIIVDEAHERSLNIDFLLGCIHQILPVRPELKLIITSATIDPGRFSRHFGDGTDGEDATGAAPIVEVSGRTYPVEVRYRPLHDDGDDEATDPDVDARPGGGHGAPGTGGGRGGRAPGPGNPGGRGGGAGRPARSGANAADPDRDRDEAIGDAIEELWTDPTLPAGRGDVLVFLSGEREIRDAAEALNGRLGPAVDVLPLYARLAHDEQHRVFRGSGGRPRVVLATNVAETSLTVPGIRYVVDTGVARISRYSSRLKVQRLPIERISQASADQRKGRCGRTSDGVCVRLYSEDDFDARDAFTDPEILRTNLASVILQMASLRLGDVEAFPFLDPPDRRQIRDGTDLLHELGALEHGGPQAGPGNAAPDDAPTAIDPPADGDSSPRRGRHGRGERVRVDGPRLTALGRRLAQLPVDPRMARMVLEADRLGCADEVIVIAAALSIQDPRERPAEHRAAADQAHARFKDEHSDFIALLNLWRYLREQQQALSGNRFRKQCKAEYLHVLRIREWQDLVSQLRRAARQTKVTINREPAEPDQVHQALLSGLLSHVGLQDRADEEKRAARDARRGRRPQPEFVGARNARFAIFPGSAVSSRRPPPWVMAAELVETTRLWGRTVARIDPAWIEPLAAHLVKRTHLEPRWSRKRGSAVATEKVTLYGLPIVADRTVAYGRIDPVVSRDLFIRHALVEGDWDGGRAGGDRILAENARRRAEVRELEERARRRDLLVEDDVLHAFYDERLPADIVGGAEFDRWWRRIRQEDPDRLTIDRDVLVDPEAAASVDAHARPTRWRQGDTVLDLEYRFDPGSDEDGVTAIVPLKALPRLRPEGFEWLVPALQAELVVALLRGLPKDVRRELVPIPETADWLLDRLEPGREPLQRAVARELSRRPGVQVTPAMVDLAAVPSHLRMRFRVVDDTDKAVAEGEDLETLRSEVRPRLRAELAAATPQLEHRGLTDWTIGTLPRAVGLPGTDGAVRAFPALVDEGQTVGVRVLDTPAAQAAAMVTGTRRLLRMTIPSPVRHVRRTLADDQQLTLSLAQGGLGAVLEDTVDATVDVLTQDAGGPVFDEAAFRALRDRVAGHLAGATVKVCGQVVLILRAEADVRRRLEALAERPAPGGAFDPTLRDVQAQLARLLPPGFVSTAGARRLPDLVRYLRAAVQRLDRLPTAVAADHDRMRAIHELEQAYAARLQAAGDRITPELRDVRWMLEELRVSHFAQALGVRGGVSAKKIRRALDD
ncbi:MAG: ATP-dependent RNA helicase HrpA [Solirubrobacteraceae bacterium]